MSIALFDIIEVFHMSVRYCNYMWSVTHDVHTAAAAAAACRVTVSSPNQRSRRPFHQSTGVKLLTLRKDEVRNQLYTLQNLIIIIIYFRT